MSDDRNTPLKLRIYSFVLHYATAILAASCRIEVSCGDERIERIVGEKTPVILAAWHNRLFYLSVFLRKRLLEKGVGVAMMSSLSQDGEIGALLGKRSGARIVRGSSSRGGTEGFRRFFRLMKREGCSTLILPDGSKGPKYEAKMGVAMLARLTGAPVVPISYAADRCWRIKSWDRLIIPKPFARISVVIGPDIRIDRDASDADLESGRQAVEDALNELKAKDAANLNPGT